MERKNKKGKIAIFQILVLLVGTIAFSFLMGGEIISAEDEDESANADEGSCSSSGGECVVVGLCAQGGLIFSGECDSGEYCCREDSIISKSSDSEDSEGDSSDIKDTAVKVGEGVATSKAQELLTEGYEKIVGDSSEPVSASTSAASDSLSYGDLNPSSKVEDVTNIETGAEGSSYNFVDYFTGSQDGWSSSLDAVKIGGEGGVSIGGYVASSLGVAFTSSKLVQMVFSIWAGERNMQSIKTGAMVGFGAGSTAALIGVAAGSGPPGWVIGSIAAAVTGIFAAFSYQEFAQEKVVFDPGAWTPVDGGEHCEECNDLRYGCSEYQCSTYGKSCGIINKGSEEEKCVHLNEDDTEPPKISALKGSLPEKFEYNPIAIETVDPPARGVEIRPKSGEECIPPYTSLTLGVNTSEPAECRMDTERRNNYDDMRYSLGSYKQYEHEFGIPSSALNSEEEINKSFKGNDSSQEVENILEEVALEEMMDREFYIRCKDPNGNEVSQAFVMEVCVDDGPDTQAPEIIRTNYEEDSYIEYNKSSVPLQVTTNEPAECRWDRTDTSYENMENEIPNPKGEKTGEYTYEGELNGIKNNKDNTFYIRCQDKPWWEEGDDGKPYPNEESHELTLEGTEPLLIDEATVNGEDNFTTIRDSTNEIGVDFEVRTSSGAENGKAICYYGEEKGEENIEFYNEGSSNYSNVNTQKDIYLTEGGYRYYFKCVDEGGNVARTNLNFDIETDNESPEITRVSKDDGSLKVITNEPGECVYSTKRDWDCSYEYDEGKEMSSSSEGTSHSTSWDSEKTFYIKCADEYGNRDLPGECSMVVRPFSF